MTTRIRGSGGAYGFVSKMFGYNHGFLVGWFLFLTYAILWANATALVLLARYLFGNALQFGFHYSMVGFDVYFGEVLLCLAAIVLCGWVCILSKRFAVRIHTFFAFGLIAGVVTCFVAALLRHQGGKALVRLIDDAIDFSKLEDGRLEFDLKPTDCAGLASGFVDSFRAANPVRAVEFRCRTGEMPTVMIDPKRVRQILFNLVDNAAKFTQQGFVEVRAAFDRDADAEAGTGTLRFEVEDTGCGISREDLKQISSPYVQVDSKQARHGGTGIGLAVCRKMVNAMGGELSIASELGKGSTFTVTIPKVEITDAAPVADEPLAALTLNAVRTNPPQSKSAEPAKAEPAKAEESAGTDGSKRILIVDDQKVNLMVLKAMLKKIGAFDIVMAKDGQEALNILTSADKPFALVLTDMWMPVMDGEGLVHAIRSEKKLAAIPVHVVTADTEMQGKYDKIGFDGMQLKPVTVDGLKSIVGDTPA